MIRFFDMLSGIGGFRVGLERVGKPLGLRLKAAHGATVAATGVGMEAAT